MQESTFMFKNLRDFKSTEFRVQSTVIRVHLEFPPDFEQ